MESRVLQGGVFLAATVFLAACGQKEISFKAEVQPIIAQYCLECHGDGGKGNSSL